MKPLESNHCSYPDSTVFDLIRTQFEDIELYLQSFYINKNHNLSFQMSFKPWNINPHPDPDVDTFSVPNFYVNKLPMRESFLDIEELVKAMTM